MMRSSPDGSLGFTGSRLYPWRVSSSWETRFEWIDSVLQWSALVIGVGLAVYGDVNTYDEITPSVITASVVVAVYTILMQAMPVEKKRTPLVGAFLAALGVAVSLFAISLTGGIGSPFLLYLAVPIFFAATTQGVVLGAVTALAAIAGTALVAWSTDRSQLEDPQFLQMMAFYALVGITFAQAYRVLIEQPQSLPALSSAAEQVARLEEAHRLLAELADLATTDDLSPVTVGRSALRDVAETVPYASGTVSIVEADGETTIATRGQPPAGAAGSGFPIEIDGRRLGTLTLWPMAGADLELHRVEIEGALRPVALAFDNVLLLQSIAHRSVREERIRVARELHDEIGPLLVSVGLGLDVAIQSAAIDPEISAHLAGLRETVGKLVDDVRRTVTMLRSTQATTVTEHAHALAADIDSNGPSIVIDIDEEGTLGEREIAQLGAIMTEAVRNAREHSEATMVRIEGQIDNDRVLLRIIDDGAGFDTGHEAAGRYGLIGMRERAGEIGAVLTVDSREGLGTTVTVAWDVP
jgi:signal transduction histidine kinase